MWENGRAGGGSPTDEMDTGKDPKLLEAIQAPLVLRGGMGGDEKWWQMLALELKLVRRMGSRRGVLVSLLSMWMWW